MDAVTPKSSQTSDAHSHLVQPQNMEWQKTRFPGCEAKTLLFDRTTGLMTALMRFAPGSVLPDHEHVNIEQTYVLEGSLVDKEGPAKGIACKSGEFIWREPHSRHAAWCPEGVLILAMFQVPKSSSRPTAASSMPTAPIGTRPGSTQGRAERRSANAGCNILSSSLRKQPIITGGRGEKSRLIPSLNEGPRRMSPGSRLAWPGRRRIRFTPPSGAARCRSARPRPSASPTSRWKKSRSRNSPQSPAPRPRRAAP